MPAASFAPAGGVNGTSEWAWDEPDMGFISHVSLFKRYRRLAAGRELRMPWRQYDLLL
jgi:hypothetical protein